jgi:hypothetical protein
MQNNNRFSSNEKKIYIGAALIALLSIAFLMFGSDSFFRGAKNDDPEIGKLVILKNEARHRGRADLSWYQAKEDMTLRNGDSLFSGPNSSAQVTLNKGGDVMIGENSLVVFETIDNQTVSNLKSGNFRVKVDGTVKLAINGELTTINGNESELQVFYEKDKKPQLRLLAGTADFKKNTGTSVKLVQNRIASFPVERAPKVEVDPVPPPFAAVPTPPVAMKPPILKATPDRIQYTWKLYDVYEQKENQLVPRAQLASQVRLNVPLEWTNGAGLPVQVMVSENPSFDPRLEYKALGTPFILNQVQVGDNFWKVSFDGQTWSAPQTFSVLTNYLANAEPSVTDTDRKVIMTEEVAHAEVILRAPIEVAGFVVQASRTSAFIPESSRTFWSASSNVALTFYKPGTYYYRFASVNKQQELSSWSNNVKFDVVTPQAPPAPILAKAKTNGTIGEEFPQSWKSAGVRTRVEILNTKGEKLDEIIGDKIIWSPERPGQYKARAYTVNSYGQESPPSKIVDIKVAPKQIAAAAKKPEVPELIVEKPYKQEPERKVSSTDSTSSAKISTPEPILMNEKYKNSQVSLTGFLWTAYSSQQLYLGQTPPLTGGAGLHGMYWAGDHSGFEGSLKTGVIGLNTTASSQVALQDLEARYHFRFVTGFPFRLARALQISGFGGYEIYRNSGGVSLVSQYDLMKFGTALQFPILNRWSTGGEVVLGRGFDSSSKTELSGNLNYFLRQDFTVGVGYRVFFFAAGGTAASPSGFLPYREGYTEGYSALNYHF